MVIKVDAIVVKEYVVGESDKYITLFTREYGIIQVGAPRAKKFDKGLASGTELFVYGEFVLTHYKHNYKLISVEPRHTFHHLRENLVILSYASYIAEFVSEVATESSGNSELLTLMLYALHSLNKSSEESAERIRRTFEMRALVVLGFTPELTRCVSCGMPVEGDERATYTFLVEEGGLCCKKCRGMGALVTLSYTTWYVLNYIRLAPYKTLFNFEIKPYVLQEMARLCDEMIAFYIEKPFKTLEFIKSLGILS